MSSECAIVVAVAVIVSFCVSVTLCFNPLTLEVSDAFNEIKDKLAAGYDHTFMDNGGIDLHGLALVNGDAASAPGASTPLTINEAAHGFEDTQEDYYGLGGRGVSSG